MLVEERWDDVKAGFDDLEDDQEGVKERVVKAWHSMPLWLDVKPAISSLMKLGYERLLICNSISAAPLVCPSICCFLVNCWGYTSPRVKIMRRV
jgi:hypothetical protein